MRKEERGGRGCRSTAADGDLLSCIPLLDTIYRKRNRTPGGASRDFLSAVIRRDDYLGAHFLPHNHSSPIVESLPEKGEMPRDSLVVSHDPFANFSH